MHERRILELYGLWDWYLAQPTEVQDYLYKSSGSGINTDPSRLTSGKYQIFHMPKELTDAVGSEKFSKYYDKYWPDTPNSVISIPYGEQIPTATSFLCQHAMNAAYDKNYPICQILLDAAFNHAKSIEDSIYQGMIAQKIGDIPRMIFEQKEVERYKPILYQFVKYNPGILQSDLKKRFPPDMENIVGLAHWHNCQDGRVRREKKGRSFQLYIQEGA